METGNTVLENPDPILQIEFKNDPRFLATPQQMSILLNSESTPLSRLFLFAKSTSNLNEFPTKEAQLARGFIGGTTLGAFVYSAVLNSTDVYDKWRRTHNASVFEGKYRRHRSVWDSVILGSAARGAPMALKMFLLSSSSSFVSFGSIVARNQLYLPDWLIGYTTIGCISRLWLGWRGVIFGSTAGFITGFGLFGFLWSIEKITGLTTTEFRYRSYLEHAEKSEAIYRHILMLQQENLKYSGVIPKDSLEE